MNITKILLLITCLSISQSFAKPTKSQRKCSSKQTYSFETLDQKACAELTKLLAELKKATPPGYRFCQTIAVQNLLHDLDEPFYIKIKTTDTTSEE